MPQVLSCHLKTVKTSLLIAIKNINISSGYFEKTADISRRHYWFPCEMTSEKRAQKFHTDDVTLPRSG